jgi:hypothetical protein
VRRDVAVLDRVSLRFLWSFRESNVKGQGLMMRTMRIC